MTAVINTIASINWETLIAAFATIWGVISTVIAAIQTKFKKKAQTAIDETNQFFDPEDDSVVEAPMTLDPVAYLMPDSVFELICSGKSASEISYIKNIVTTNEAAGVSNYVITLPSGKWYKIDYGQISDEGDADSAYSNKAKILMKENVFDVMTSSETDEWKAKIREEMAAKDAIGEFPYTITSEKWIYTIKRTYDKNGNDYTDIYGTQFIANPIYEK